MYKPDSGLGCYCRLALPLIKRRAAAAADRSNIRAETMRYKTIFGRRAAPDVYNCIVLMLSPTINS